MGSPFLEFSKDVCLAHFPSRAPNSRKHGENGFGGIPHPREYGSPHQKLSMRLNSDDCDSKHPEE